MEIFETSQVLKFLLALIFVISLMGGLAFVMKRFGYGQARLPLKKRRLKLVESLSIDPRRRLILVQRDETQHLLITGQNGETVIETGISPRPEDAEPEDTGSKTHYE